MGRSSIAFYPFSCLFFSILLLSTEHWHIYLLYLLPEHKLCETRDIVDFDHHQTHRLEQCATQTALNKYLWDQQMNEVRGRARCDRDDFRVSNLKGFCVNSDTSNPETVRIKLT